MTQEQNNMNEEFEFTAEQIEARNLWRTSMRDQLLEMGIPEEVAERAINKASYMIDENEKNQKLSHNAAGKDLQKLAEHKLVHYLYAHVQADWSEATLDKGPELLVGVATVFGQRDKAETFIRNQLIKQLLEGVSNNGR